jgi:MFS superfamily sulfate permease-like transporter
VAGLTVWAVLVPEALAYAMIAGVSPCRTVRDAVAGLSGAGLVGAPAR